MATQQETEHGEGHSEHEVNIFVNSRTKTVAAHEIGFDEVVRLAFPDAVFGPDIIYTVTYRHGDHNAEGQLTEGRHVPVRNGMAFNVGRTDRS